MVIPFRMHLSQRTTKPTIRLVRPAKSQISLHVRAVWSVIADRISLLQPPAYPKRDKRVPHTGIVFAGHKSLVLDRVVRWLIYLNYSWC